MRDGINRLRHAKRYSGQFSTICTSLSWSGYLAGAGRMTGVDPREIAKSDCVVHLGHQCGGDPDQRDDPCDAGAQGARRAARRRRRLRQRDDEAGRRQADHPARHGWRARLRGDACPVSRRLRRPRLSGDAMPTSPRPSRRIWRRARRNGRRRSAASRRPTSKPSRALLGQRPRDVLPPRLRLCALAQRRRQHACRQRHPAGARQLAI